MKKLFFPAVPVLLIFILFACYSIDLTTEPDSSRTGSGLFSRPRTNESASEEQQHMGTITIYTSMYGDVVDDIEIALAREFPNVKVEFSYGGTGTIQARIEQEISLKGKLGCDILMVADPSYSMELKERGYLHPFTSTHTGDLVFSYDPQGYWYPVRVSNMVLAYNPDRTLRSSVPSTFYNFANDQSLRGLISMANPITSGTALASITALREKYGYTYFEALARQNINLDSSAVALEKLQAGEYRVIMVLEEAVLKLRAEERSRLEVIYPEDGTIVIPSTIMIIDDNWSANANSAAAKMVADWFLSEAGQRAIVAGWMHPVRSNSRVPYNSVPIGDILSNSMPVNWNVLYSEKDEIITRFEENIVYRR